MSLRSHFVVCRDSQALGRSTKTSTDVLTCISQNDNSNEDVKTISEKDKDS